MKRNMMTHLLDKVYVSMAQMGDCRVCGRHEDLRLGACFDCSDKVDGRELSPGTHELWEIDNPDNRWIAAERGH
jgi:hypothetical protein